MKTCGFTLLTMAMFFSSGGIALAQSTPNAQTARQPEPTAIKVDKKGKTENPEKKSNAQLAKEVSNPLANLMLVPFENNWDTGGGIDNDGQHYFTRFQPVIPPSTSPKTG